MGNGRSCPFGDTAKMITGVHRLVDGGYTIH